MRVGIGQIRFSNRYRDNAMAGGDRKDAQRYGRRKRNRALLAFAILTGMRDGALATIRLKHVDIDERYVFQDGRKV